MSTAFHSLDQHHAIGVNSRYEKTPVSVVFRIAFQTLGSEPVRALTSATYSHGAGRDRATGLPFPEHGQVVIHQMNYGSPPIWRTERRNAEAVRRVLQERAWFAQKCIEKWYQC